MKKMWKNVLGVAFVVIVSIGAAIGTSTYLINKNHDNTPYTEDPEYGFKQPVRLTNYSTVAAENIDFTVAAESAVHAVVHIKSTQKSRQQDRQYIDPFEYFFGRGGGRGYQQQPRVGFGSGVIISTDGYIITNNHVIESADEIEVALNDSRTFKAKLVGTDPATDIALLKIEGKDFATIPFGDSDKLKVGEWVLAVGNPFNLTSTVTAGIISAKGRGVMAGPGDMNKISSYIQTDAAVNPGNSGGALVNTKGELIGINTMILSETGSYAGYSFAVPISIAGKVVSDIKKYGTVQRAVLGVSIRDVKVLKDLLAMPAEQSNMSKEEREKAEKVKVLEGAFVGDFAMRSSAKEAGIEVGDVITAINDVSVKTANGLQEQVNKYRPGDKVKVSVDRAGTKKTFTVELRNMQGNTEVVKGTGDTAELLGAAFKELTSQEKQKLGISYGIEVSGVTSGKLRDAGVQKGYIIMIVNDQKVSSVEDFEKIVDATVKSSGDDKVLFIKGISPSGRTRYYAIDLTE